MTVLAAENTTSIAIISAVFIAGGWVLVTALWFFVFRKTDEPDPTEGEASPQESDGRPGSGPSAGPADGAPQRE